MKMWIIAVLMAIALPTMVVGQTAQMTGEPSPAQTVSSQSLRTWEFKSPDQVSISELDLDELEVVSVQNSETGDQRDYIKAGMASTYLFHDKYGVMRIHKAAKKHKACDNRVIKLWVPEKRKIICPVGPEGRPGTNGAPGGPGPRGPRGFQGTPGQGTVNNYYTYNCAPTMMPGGQIGGAYGASVAVAQAGSFNWQPNNPMTFNVWNNNSLVGVNQNLNNLPVNIGPGSSAGTIQPGPVSGIAGSGNTLPHP